MFKFVVRLMTEHPANRNLHQAIRSRTPIVRIVSSRWCVSLNLTLCSQTKISTNSTAIAKQRTQIIMVNYPLALLSTLGGAFLLGSIDATCTCKDVCPSYTDVWQIRSDCPPGGMERCIHYILLDSQVTCLAWEKAPEGGCVCNVFGCNCDGCGCYQSTRRSLRAGGAPDPFALINPEDACEDYRFYMSMSENERYNYLADKHCGNSGLSASAPDIRAALEQLADINNDGTLSCDEFNAAEFNIGSFGFCKRYN